MDGKEGEKGTGEGTTPKPEITAEYINQYAEENNLIVVPKSDFANIISGGEPENALVKKTFSAVKNNYHKATTKEVKSSVENHIFEVTGIAKNENESVFDYSKRVYESKAGDSQDAKDRKAVIDKLKGEIEEYKSAIDGHKKEKAQISFNAEFSPIFEATVSQYGEINPKMKAKLLADFSQKIYSERTIDGENVEYRKGKRIVDENANEYTPVSLIESYMSEYGYEKSEAKEIKAQKKGAPEVKSTKIDKDNQDAKSLSIQANDNVIASLKGRTVSEITFTKLRNAEYKRLKDEQSK